MESLLNKLSKWALLVCMASASCLAFGEEIIYRWVDSDGNVQFGDRPPSGVEATAISPGYESGGLSAQSPVGAAEPAGANEELSAAEQQRQDRAERRQAALEEQRKLEQNCATMSDLRAKLEPRTRVLVMGENGEPYQMEDEERLKLLGEAKAYLEAYCD